MCPYPASEVLDDLLETNELLQWQERQGRYEIPTMAHVNLNYHGRAYEEVDHYLRHTMHLLAKPPTFFEK